MVNLKILHIIASVDMSQGGPIQAVLQTVDSLPSDQSLEVVSLDDPNALYVKDFPAVVHALGPTAKKYGYTPKLAEWIIENASRFDAAVIHGLWNHASVGGWHGCYKANLPYVIFTHGMMDPWFKKAYPLKHWLKQLFWIVQGRALRDAKAVLFTCEEEKRLAYGVFWGYEYTPKVVAFGAPDVPQIDEKKAHLAFEQALPQISGRPYLLYLSRIHEKKGCDLLLQAFASIKHRPELQLIMAGPCHDDYIDKLKNLSDQLGISDRVHWPGMLKGESKAGAFRAAEAFVLTSHQENFGIAVAEALAYGKAVLISNQINIWREIEQGGGGIVGSDTVEGATEVLKSWENKTSEQRRKISESARQVYEQNFTVEAATRDLTLALKQAIASK